MARRTKAEIEKDKMIQRCTSRALDRLSIDMFDISKVSAAVKEAVDAGKPEEEVYQAGRTVAEQLQKT